MNERDSGITDKHEIALQNLMKEQNTFLFVRPTEYDSTLLIKEGYATKSMDIHHKSSNWGPMAGFVPCDPAFSKKLDGNPDPTKLGVKHAKAHPVQLFLKPSLLNGHPKIRKEKSYVLEQGPTGGLAAFGYQRFTVKPISAAGMSGMLTRTSAQATSGGLPPHRFVRDRNASGTGTRATLFCLIKKGDSWLVYWVKWQDPTARSGRLHPLNVFAYPGPGGLNPVTGDYDMWMVAPHISHMPKHSKINAVVDAHGSSAASIYITELIKTMNAACGQANTPVFNHGAEEQNFGFTQTLDQKLAMITPGGTSRMVLMGLMPNIMADIQNAGYLVIWNKSYGSVDPKLSGKENPEWVQFRSGLDSALETLRQFRSGISADRQKQIAKEWVANANAKQSMPQEMKTELLQAVQARRERMRVAKSNTPEGAIFNFHQELSKLLGRGHIKLLTLNDTDFPDGYHRTQTETLKLQRALQQAIVDSTTGGGESDPAKLAVWFKQNQADLANLKGYWNIT